MSPDDPHPPLDDQLRSVPLPTGMLMRLRAIPEAELEEFTDQDLDEMLATLTVPLSVTMRLHHLLEDEALDERLRDVDLPVRTLARARIISRQRQQRRFATLMGATAVLLMLTVGCWGMLGSVLWGVRPDDTQVASFVYHGPLQIDAELATVEFAEQPPVAAVRGVPVLQTGSQSDIEAPQLATPPRGLLVDWQRELDRGLDPWQDVMLLKWNVLGAPPSNEHMAMQTVSFPDAKGVSLPLARGYDRRFLNVHGIHPPMFLGVNPQLRRATLPLTSGTDSFRRLRLKVAEGRGVATEQVRVEEFLAAMPYRFPPPKKKALGIRVAAGPALFGDGRSQIVQVGVRAKSRTPRRIPATHLVLAIDASHSMGWENHWPAVLAGLGDVLAQFGPDDRLSLVGFNEHILVDVESASREDLREVLHAMGSLQPSGGSAAGLGLARCATLATEAASAKRAVQMVFVTDGRLMVGEETLRPLAGMLSELASQNVRLQVLQLGNSGTFAEVESLASAAETRVVPVADGEELGERLLTMLLGNAATVASEVAATVTFNPKAIAAYRLLGHEANAIALVEPTERHVDFAANAEAVGLYEVWLRPGDAVELANVELRWRDPATGRWQRERQRISRFQVATSWEECALSLQLAQLVAETADVLRGGYRFEWTRDGKTQAKLKPPSLRHVQDALRYTHPALLERVEVRELVEMLENISRIDSRGNR